MSERRSNEVASRYRRWQATVRWSSRSSIAIRQRDRFSRHSSLRGCRARDRPVDLPYWLPSPSTREPSPVRWAAPRGQHEGVNGQHEPGTAVIGGFRDRDRHRRRAPSPCLPGVHAGPARAGSFPGRVRVGLSLVQRLAEMHGGRVTATAAASARGASSSSLCRAPEGASAEPSETRVALEPSDAGPTRPLRILAVDDQEDLADSVAELLQDTGHETMTVGDGPARLGDGPDVRRTRRSSCWSRRVIVRDWGVP